MQVTVPHSEYGACQYFMPTILREWVVAHGLDNRYVGGSSWGDGTFNGVTNCESTYMVDDIDETDAIAFKLQFPRCRVFMAGQT